MYKITEMKNKYSIYVGDNLTFLFPRKYKPKKSTPKMTRAKVTSSKLTGDGKSRRVQHAGHNMMTLNWDFR